MVRSFMVGILVVSIACGCAANKPSDTTTPQTASSASTSTAATTVEPSTTTQVTTTTTAPQMTVSTQPSEFDEDVELIIDLYEGWTQAVAIGLDEIEAYFAAHLYLDLPRCAPGEKTLPMYTPQQETIQRDDHWVISWGPLDGERPVGRVYAVQLAELDSPSHVTILHGVAYVFWNCGGISPTRATFAASVAVESGTMHAYSAWNDPDAGEFFGSGCSPGTENLPDGVWYGRITNIAVDNLSFDLYCKGPPPADGEEWQFTIVNSNTKIRTVPIGLSAQVFAIAPDGGHAVQPYSAWYQTPHPTMFCPNEGCWDVVLFINQGHATEIIQTWTP